VDLFIDRRRVNDCHWMLLRLAGSIHDDLVVQCRRWLAEQRTTDVARAIMFAVLSQRLRLDESDIDLLAELLGAAELDNSALWLIEATDFDSLPPFGFSATRQIDRAARTLRAADARPAPPVTTTESEDDTERALLTSMMDECAIRAVWRTWRLPGDGGLWPPARRVFVVEADRGAPLAELAARLQHTLAMADEPSPQVEVYPVRATLPSYQRLARVHGALIWARDPDPGVRIATVYDAADLRGRHMTSDYEMIHGPQACRILHYLRHGEPLMATDARMIDVVDTSLGQAVPMNFRTDGFWIWSDTATYYLDRYGLAPDPDLVAHICRRRFEPPEVDGAALHRALVALQEPSATEPAWTFGV
jgi:hypothetical protein